MKIVFLEDSIYEYALGNPKRIGGAERQQWLLARALSVAGWSVTVGVQGSMKSGDRCAIEGVEFVGIGQGRAFLPWYRFLRAERPDWWYWRTASHLFGPAVGIAKLANVKTIFAAAFDTDVIPRLALSWRPRLWPLYAWGLSGANRIFVQHGGQLADLAPELRPKSYVIPNIVAETATIKAHSDRSKYVAWVGMLRQPKRPDLLVEIARKAPGIHFIVCGGQTHHRSPQGYSEQMVEALCALPNVEYRGQVAPDKALQAIAEAAMLLSTSDAEGFPNTFLEAWSAGTPVVSLKIDPDRVIEQEGLGVIAGNPENAIAGITTLMDSPQRREEIAVRSRLRIAKIHSSASVTTAFECAVRS